MATEAEIVREIDWWNEEYRRCFGVYPSPMMQIGVYAIDAIIIQSKVMRYWTEEAKKAAGK